MPEPEAVSPARQLVADGLILRPYHTDDAPLLFAAARESIDSVGRWLPWCHAQYSEAESVAWIRHCAEAWTRGDQYTFAIFDAANGEFVGSVGLSERHRAHNFAGLGYWIRQSARGRRIAARAGRLAVDFALDAIKLARVEIVVAVHNHASRRTAELIGATFEGIARNRLILPFNQRSVDAAIYALIAGPQRA